MNLESLRSLQKRIREAKGADRALDWEIGFHVGGIGAEKERRLFAEMGPRCFTEKDKHGITPYGKARGDFVRPAKRGSREPFEHFTACDGPSPLMMCPRYTLDPDGLGPCVALMREVLPGCEWGRNTNGHWFIFETPTVVLAWALPLANDCLRFLDAIVSALIAQEEAKEKADV